MTTFSKSNKEITLIYNSDDHIGQKILAYAHSENIPVRDINLKFMKLTATHWAQLATMMNVKIRDFVNTEHPNFSQKFGKSDQLSSEDWLKLLINNPEILRAPVVIKGDKVSMMTNPQEMLGFVNQII